jgi:hypothetical protein
VNNFKGSTRFHLAGREGKCKVKLMHMVSKGMEAKKELS